MKIFGTWWKVRPELIEDYKKAHDEIWPDFLKAVKDAGFKNFSLFGRKDGLIFAYFEHNNVEKGWEKLFSTEINRKWQESMEKYFLKTDNSILGPESEDLKMIWHMD